MKEVKQSCNGLNHMNSHIGLISSVSRHSKPPVFFFSNNIICYSPIGLQSLKALHKAVFLIYSALQQNAMKGYFCFGLPDLRGNRERGEQPESYCIYHHITLATLLREYCQQAYYTVLFSEIYN